MKTIYAPIVAFALLSLCGCEFSRFSRPLRLYDTGNGNIIQVYFQRISLNGGKLISGQSQGETFQGECILYGSTPDYTRPPLGMPRSDAASNAQSPQDDANFAELYGFGKESQARPVGTAVIVGNKGTTIEIVLYRLSADQQFGDGIGKDNNGRRYRVFLTTE